MRNFSREFIVPRPLHAAFRLVFDDPKVMDAVHGPGRWKADPWVDSKRKLEFEMAPDNIPPAVLKVIGNGKMAAGVSQERNDVSMDVICIKNKVRPKVVGAEFVKVRPTFTLRALPGGKETALAVSCNVCAILPPPFNGIVEEFMRHAAEVSFDHLEAAVTSKPVFRFPKIP